MLPQHMLRFLALWMVLCLLVVSSGLPIRSLPLAQAQSPEQQAHLTAATPLEPFDETEPNNANVIDQNPNNDESNLVGPADPAATPSWQQTISGRVATPDDQDWFRIEISEPASNIALELTDLAADFDLILISAANVAQEGDAGLENVVDLRRKARSTRRKARSTSGSVVAVRRKARSTGGDIAALSIEPGTTAEEIDTILWLPGTYYIVVSGDNGVFSDQPYTLNVQVTGSDLDYQDLPMPSVRIQQAPNANVTILFVMNSDRMTTRYPADAVIIEELRNRLQSLADSDPAVELLDLANIFVGTDVVTEAYNLWDSDPSNPFYANYVASTFDALLTAATLRNPSDGTGPPLYPNTEYIVLVGGDEIIPFYRVPDLAFVANEGEYLPYLSAAEAEEGGSSGVINPGSPLWGALNYRTILTDDIYGNDEPYQLPYHPLYVPDRAVGRLVETPTEILTYLDQYYPSAGLGAPLEIAATGGKAVVTGYDFLSDQALEVADRLTTLGFTPTARLNRLINNTWNTADLQESWFDGDFASFASGSYSSPSSVQVQSINGHFDHMWAIPAEEGVPSSEYLLAETILNSEPVSPTAPRYFENRLCYSVGCHSGLNIEGISTAAGAQPLYQADFPQAFIRQGGNWIGNTGFGYGDADVIGYSERLSLFLTEELGRNVLDSNDEYIGESIGTAMIHAKQRYIRNASALDVHDIKALMIWTLYGLPFLRVQVDTPQDFPSEEAAPDDHPDDIDQTLGLSERIITFTMDINPNVAVVRSGNLYPLLEGVSVEDSFVQAGFAEGTPPEVRVVEATQAGLPLMPEFAYDLSVRAEDGLENVLIKDVTFLGGNYTTLADYTPQISQIVTQDIDLLPPGEPDAALDAGIWYPDLLFESTRTVVSSGAEGDTRDQLVVVPAQFKADPGSTEGTMRLYDTLVFKVLYLDPSQAPAALRADVTPPVIASVRVLENDDGQQHLAAPSVTVVVEASDDVSGAQDISVEGVYSQDDQAWLPITFARNEATGRWQTTIPGTSDSAHYIIQVRDQAGNVASFTGKGQFIALAGELNAVQIDGPAAPLISSATTYTATVEPATAVTPIEYTWSPEPAAGQGTATATYSFATAGTQTITVTAENIGGTVTRAYQVEVIEPLTSVEIAGPSRVATRTSEMYTATVRPATATQPISYTWSPEPAAGQGTASATYRFAEPGRQSIGVRVENAGGGLAERQRLITIEPRMISLPIIRR